MSSSLTRREFLTRAGMAVAAIQTLDHLDPCCAFAADAKTSGKELFELKPVADGIYAAIAAPRYKVNCNAAVILTNDGVIVVSLRRFRSRMKVSGLPAFDIPPPAEEVRDAKSGLAAGW